MTSTHICGVGCFVAMALSRLSEIQPELSAVAALISIALGVIALGKIIYGFFSR